MNLSEKELKALRAEQERVEARDKRIAALPPALSETRSNAIILSDVKLQSQESARVFLKGHLYPRRPLVRYTLCLVPSWTTLLRTAHACRGTTL